jgi:hypothetical protein
MSSGAVQACEPRLHLAVRALCLLLVACSASAEKPLPSATAVPAASARTVADGKTRARISAVTAEGSWTDIVVDGTDDHAKQFCIRLVTRSASMGSHRDGLHVVRECSIEPLPPVTVGNYRLVDREEVDQHSVELDAVLRGTTPDATPARGIVIHHVPFADRDSCETTRARLAAEAQRDWESVQRAADADTEERLRRAREDEAAACTRAQQETAACAKLEGDARSTCLLDAGPARIVCEHAQREREMLDARRARPRVAPTVRAVCRARPDIRVH